MNWKDCGNFFERGILAFWTLLAVENYREAYADHRFAAVPGSPFVVQSGLESICEFF
jgi:hypothetical protein